MSLKEKFRDDFRIGAAVNTRTIQTHRDLLLREFNSLTCENEMKYAEVTNDGETYDFSRADAILDFAEENGLAMRMHTLLWHNQSPAAIFKNTSREQLIGTLKRHIGIMANRCGKQVYACDVANEVIADSSEKIVAAGLFRKSPWLEIIGEDFCDIAFTLAKEAMPDVPLFYNDYSEWDPDKGQRIARLVREMRERGVPVDGLGLQCHWNINEPNQEQMKRMLERYSGLGVELHITELDISVYEDKDTPPYTAPTPELLERQALRFEEAFSLFRQYPVTSVTTWGIADDATWLDHFPVRGRKNWPLLFDEGHNPKPAWHSLMAL